MILQPSRTPTQYSILEGLGWSPCQSMLANPIDQHNSVMDVHHCYTVTAHSGYANHCKKRQIFLVEQEVAQSIQL